MWLLFKNVFEICTGCENELPINLYNRLLELEKLNGAYDGLTHVLNGGRSSYTSHRFANEVIEVLADCVKENCMQKVSESEVIGLIIDETTDISVSSQMISYYKVCCEGKPEVIFAGLDRLVNGTAATIDAAVAQIEKRSSPDI
eukprot:Pompholyxophrys_punicea_v1_NODE_369_length_2134_cov_3.138047.p2 type:complete len:144 gc:universal NODE_369_length_2134_cov_3.138047:657-1088(+)